MKTKPVYASDWLAFARGYLVGLPGKRGLEFQPEAGLDAQVMLGHALGKPRAWVIAHPETLITPQQQRELTGLLARLAAGEPLPYLTGHWEFFGLDFLVTPAVLIPRPETELLVEEALHWLQAHPQAAQAADVGTGSGCIAISLARHCPRLRVLAVDRAWDALQVARKNTTRLDAAAQIRLLQSNLLSAIRGPLDLVCANLPYIPHDDLADLPVAHHEPRLALDGGPDGLDAIRALLADAPRWLTAPGLLLLEMQFDQGDAITRVARAHLPHASVAVLPDLAGLPRLVRIELSG